MTQGTIQSIRGSVVEVQFKGTRPAMHTLLHGKDNAKLLLEVRGFSEEDLATCLLLTDEETGS